MSSYLRGLNVDIATLTYLTIVACLIYVLAVDANVSQWLVLLFRSVLIWFQRQWYKVRFNPDSPWVRWQIDRNANRIAKKLTKEYDEK